MNRHIYFGAKIGLVLACLALSGLFFSPNSNGARKNAHCILQKEFEQIRVKQDGTYVDIDEIYVKVLDEKGKRQQQVQSFFLNKNYSRLEILKFELIHPNGNRKEIDWKANSKQTNPAQSARMNIYDPNQKVITVFVPGLQIGDTIHYKVRINNFKPMIEGQFFGNAVIQRTFPVKEIELEIILPPSKRLYTLLKDRAKGVIVSSSQKLKGNKRICRWKFQNIEELVPEPNMPELSRVAMRLLFSTMKSWKDVSVWYYNLSEPKLRPTRAIINKVKELTKGKKDPIEKARALFFFVSRKIRYMGLIEEAKRPGFEPHDVGLTFERRYGVCRDKAALLVSMLRVAGLKAVPVLLKAGGKLDNEIPIPYFNHAICAILDKNGKPGTYMDPTSETSNQFLPDYEQDSSCLPATQKGSDLLVTPINPPSKNLFKMTIKDKLDPDGLLSGTITIETRNFIDTVFRSILMQKTKDQQKRFLQTFILKRRPGLSVKDLSWTNPSDTKTPFSFRCTFSLKNPLKAHQLFPISMSRDMGLLDTWIISRASMVKRRYPLKLGYAVKTIVREEMDTSEVEDIVVYLPDKNDIVTPLFSMTTDFGLSKGKLVIERSFMNKALEVPPSQYKDLLRLQAELLREEFTPVVAEKAERRR